jgi:hypothetical protein
MLPIWGNCEAKYFLPEIWTTQISLNRLDKLIFTRTRFRELPGRIREADACKTRRFGPSGESIFVGHGARWQPRKNSTHITTRGTAQLSVRRCDRSDRDSQPTKKSEEVVMTIPPAFRNCTAGCSRFPGNGTWTQSGYAHQRDSLIERDTRYDQASIVVITPCATGDA